MEANGYVKLMIILALVFIPTLVFGYSSSLTHPLLTSEAIKLSGANGQSNFSESEERQIVQGSIDEDDVPRWL
jgi:hypothetical protein